MGRLHDRTQAVNEQRIALWGPAGSGKRTFVAALEPDARRRQLALCAQDTATEETLRDLRLLRARCRFPDSERVEPLPLLRLLLYARRPTVTAAFSLATLATSDVAVTTVPPVVTALPSLEWDGLLCLLDPTAALLQPWQPSLSSTAPLPAVTPPAVALQSLLAQLRVDALARSGQFPRRIAICLTKMDQPEHYSHLGRETTYLRRLFGSVDLTYWFDHTQVRIFGCSAVGVLRRSGYQIANVGRNEAGQAIMLDPTVAPLHCCTPLHWVLGLS